MKKFLLLGFMLMFAFTFSESWAQERTVSGKVTSIEDGSTLPGVNVVLKGTTSGTVTDIDGNYKLTVPSEGGTLVFSFIGLATEEVAIGSRSVVDIQMSPDVTQLSEVIVTAQGIERKKEALGFAVSQVDEEQIAQKTEGDIGRILRSKASGVQITQQSGVSGSATNIVIRGYNSINGDNQPLFIVDGVPFNTDTNAPDDFVDGNISSSRFLDLDPNNIADISVLKGLAAATLYGSAGRNGVILITTKNGSQKSKSEISVTQSYFVNEIASLPDYQDSFGGGFDQSFGWFFSNWGPGFYRDGVGGWGSSAAHDANGTVLHPYSSFSSQALRDAFPELQGARYEWKPYDNVSDFFRKGGIYNASINASGVSNDGKTSYNVNYGYLEDEGFTPGNELSRNNLGAGVTMKLDNRFTISSTLNMSRTEFITPPVAASTGNGSFGTGSSVFGHLFFTPRNIDLMGLPFENPVTGGSVYYRSGNDIQNPRWTAKNVFFKQIVDRVYGSAAATFNVTDNINVMYRFGYDIFNERNEDGQNKGGSEGPVLGRYRTWDNKNTLYDHTFTVNGGFEIASNASLSFNVGANGRRQVRDQQGVSSVNQTVFGTFRHFNFEQQSPIQDFAEQNLYGVFGQLELDYNGYLFFTLAGRNDWVSNFATENASIFYPSASAALLISELLPGITSSGIVNMLKLRGGYGTSAGFRGGYPVATTLDLDTRRFITPLGSIIGSNTTGEQLGNTNLKPETINEIEVGLESNLLDNRIQFGLTLYKRFTKDLIVSRPLDPSTGYTSTITNIGEVEGEGIEIDVTGTVLKTASGFTWTVGTNFFSNRDIVTDLGQDTENIGIAGFTDLGNFAVKNEQLGIMMGSRVLRDDDGNLVVNSQGDYVDEAGLFIIGNPNPDFTWNINNTLSYKNFNFSFLFNWVQGGDMYSSTVSTLLGRGLITETEDRLNTFILPGVKQDGTPNDIQINNSTYYFNNVLFGPSELQVYDATAVRLQEISLGYSLPKAIVDKLPINALSLTASGFNLWFRAINTPAGARFDPNVAGTGVGNGRGFEFLNGPSSRRYGLSLKVTF